MIRDRFSKIVKIGGFAMAKPLLLGGGFPVVIITMGKTAFVLQNLHLFSGDSYSNLNIVKM